MLYLFFIQSLISKFYIKDLITLLCFSTCLKYNIFVKIYINAKQMFHFRQLSWVNVSAEWNKDQDYAVIGKDFGYSFSLYMITFYSMMYYACHKMHTIIPCVWPEHYYSRLFHIFWMQMKVGCLNRHALCWWYYWHLVPRVSWDNKKAEY